LLGKDAHKTARVIVQSNKDMTSTVTEGGEMVRSGQSGKDEIGCRTVKVCVACCEARCAGCRSPLFFSFLSQQGMQYLPLQQRIFHHIKVCYKRRLSTVVARLDIPPKATVEDKVDYLIRGHNELVDSHRGLVSAVHNLDKKVDQGFAAANARMDQLDEKMDQGFAAANARMDQLDQKMDQGFAAANVRMNRIEKKIDESIVKNREYLTKVFGTLSNDFEVFCSRAIRQKYPEIRDVKLAEEVVGEEVDIFSEDPLFVGECTLRLYNLRKIRMAIRKKRAIEEHYGKPCLAVVFANRVEPELVAAAEETARKAGVVLIHGMNYSARNDNGMQ
jgi:hypothetical protein